MRRDPVTSETIASMGYEPERLELEIEFRHSGDVYLYSGVPPEEYAAFVAAESKGTYLNQVFKRKGYRYAHVRASRRA